jgi:hypothetical protein
MLSGRMNYLTAFGPDGSTFLAIAFFREHPRVSEGEVL